MRISHSIRRAGFSLLEMVLALAIAMILLAALYVTLNSYLSASKAGRETLHEASLARNILTRVGEDIVSQIGARDPRGLPDPGASSSGTSSSSSSTNSSSSSSSSSTGSSSSGTTANSTTGTMSGTTTTVTNNDAVLFNFGVSGDTGVLVLSGSRVQKPRPVMNGMVTESVSSDLRCVMYWIVMNGSETLGLARHEVKVATANEIDLSPTNLQDQAKYVIAPEVKSILFEYWDGTAWQTTWDGTAQASEDGIPLGPPSAIRVSITLKRNANPGSNDSSDGPTYQNVFALPTGNNFPQKAATTPP